MGTITGSFQVGPDGASSYTIPITVPPGTSGMAPSLELTYQSSGIESTTGVGFGLTGLSGISRCPVNLDQDGYVHPVDYTQLDRYCMDGKHLLAVNGRPHPGRQTPGTA